MLTGAFRKVVGLGASVYGAFNLYNGFNTLAAVGYTGAYATGTVLAMGLGVLALGVGLKFLLSDPQTSPV